MKPLILCAITLLASSCFVEFKSQNRTFVVKAASFNILGIQVPDDPQVLAEEQVPRGSTILTVNTTPHPAGTFLGVWGFFNRYLIGYDYYMVAGTVK